MDSPLIPVAVALMPLFITLRKTEVGQTEQKVGVKAGKRYRFLSGFQRGAITQVFDSPCELRLSRHSINQPGS